MAKYTIVGVEHREGISKKTNRPYNMDVLHVVAQKQNNTENFRGCAVDTIPIGRESGILTFTPAPGETVEISFNRAGFVEDCYRAE